MLKVTEHDAIAIRGGRVIDPFSQRDEIADVNLVNGRVASAAPSGAHVIDATGWIICPGLIDTEMVRTTIPDERVRAYAEGFPISRLGTPDEVAELVAFLASDRAAYITGASLDINGGDLMI